MIAQDIWKNYSTDSTRLLVHGTAVALNGRGALFLGPSGTGKSDLALQLMALGCQLIADDRVWVTPGADGLMLSTPDQIAHRIEMRGIGLLSVPEITQGPLSFCVHLSKKGEARCPAAEYAYILNHKVRMISHVGPARAAACVYNILLYGPEALDPNA